ncbi:MAG: hypothetical protein K0U68_10540 [Gammaproteobacteria bacterium]|nr:hypothetical protein [Gammaproteobacteria bacterium]
MTVQFEFGFDSAPQASITGTPSDTNPANFAMLPTATDIDCICVVKTIRSGAINLR